MVADELDPRRSVIRGKTYLWMTPAFLALGVGCAAGAIGYLGGAAGRSDVLSGLGAAGAALLCVGIAVRAAMGGIRADSRGIKITKVWSRYYVPWTALEAIDYEVSGWSNDSKPIEWMLRFFRTEGRPVTASFPRGRKEDMSSGGLGSHRQVLLGMRDHALGWSDDDVATAWAEDPAVPSTIQDGPTDPWQDKAQVVSLIQYKLEPSAVEVAAVIRVPDGRYIHRRVTCLGTDLRSGLLHLFAPNPQRLTYGGQPSAPRVVHDRYFGSADRALEEAQGQDPPADPKRWMDRSSFAKYVAENLANQLKPEAARVGILGMVAVGAVAVALFVGVIGVAWFVPPRLGLDDNAQGDLFEGGFYFGLIAAGLASWGIENSLSKHNLGRAKRRSGAPSDPQRHIPPLPSTRRVD